MMRTERTNIKKIAAFVAATILITSLGALSICPVKAKAAEQYKIIDIADVHMGEGPEDNFWPYKDKWYDTAEEAFRNADLRIYQQAQLRDRYILFYGWKTHECTILAPYGLTMNKEGKFALTYLNDYDNQYYLRSCYE